MPSHKYIFAAAAFCFALMIGGSVSAAPIDYIFSGTFDGTLGSSSFSDQAFTVTLAGDTGNVTSSGGEFANVATTASFTVGATTGSLLGTFNDVVLNPSYGPGVGAVIFGQLVSSPPSFVGEGVVTTPLATYDLTTALALTSGTVTQTPGSTYLTSAGDLVFSNISSLSFEAELTPTPLPAALPMFLAGLMGLGFLGYQRRAVAK